VETADVLIVGSGPAGAIAALNLAPLRRVLLIDRRAEPGPRIGESLLPAARRLLTDMGLLAAFEAEGHQPYYGNRSVWTGPEPRDTNFLRDPDGYGWHLDRPRFERWLRRMARSRGATLLAPARVLGLAWHGDTWRITLQAETDTVPGTLHVSSRVVIDAGGRAAPVARRLGARRLVHDRLLCGWVLGQETRRSPDAGFSYIEAAETGWWYTAPVPGQRRVLAFHTDADLPAARLAGVPGNVLAQAAEMVELRRVLDRAGFQPLGTAGCTAAHSATLWPCTGHGWLAAGDAALGFDPLSSQGLFNALYTGLAAAEAAERCLAGDDTALPGYAQAIANIEASYRRHLGYWYGLQPRWPHAPFWARRRLDGLPG
jgi:flavin-dependent dehydrogenase